MSVRQATKGSEFGDGLAWLWLSLGLTAVPTARRLLLPKEMGAFGVALDAVLFAVLVLALVMLGASVVLILLSLQIMWGGRGLRGARRTLLAALLPVFAVLAVASKVEPAYGPTATAAGLAIMIGLATNAAFASFSARHRRGRGNEATGRGLPGTHG